MPYAQNGQCKAAKRGGVIFPMPREGFENVPGPQVPTLSEKRLPSPRITPEVHHGNDEDFVLLDVINQAKRKSVCPAAASPPREHSPRFGSGKNSGHRAFDFIKEPPAKPVFGGFIIHDCFAEFLKRSRGEPMIH